MTPSTQKKPGFSRNRKDTKKNDGLTVLSTGKIKKKIRDTQRALKSVKSSKLICI